MVNEGVKLNVQSVLEKWMRKEKEREIEWNECAGTWEAQCPSSYPINPKFYLMRSDLKWNGSRGVQITRRKCRLHYGWGVD